MTEHIQNAQGRHRAVERDEKMDWVSSPSNVQGSRSSRIGTLNVTKIRYAYGAVPQRATGLAPTLEIIRMMTPTLCTSSTSTLWAFSVRVGNAVGARPSCRHCSYSARPLIPPDKSTSGLDALQPEFRAENSGEIPRVDLSAGCVGVTIRASSSLNLEQSIPPKSLTRAFGNPKVLPSSLARPHHQPHPCRGDLRTGTTALLSWQPYRSHA